MLSYLLGMGGLGVGEQSLASHRALCLGFFSAQCLVDMSHLNPYIRFTTFSLCPVSAIRAYAEVGIE